MKKLYILAPLFVVAMVLAGCFAAPVPQADGGLTIRVNNLINSKVLMPDISLDAAEFQVHGDGVSGAATGASFDITLDAATPTANVNLLPGDWNITCDAMNDDVPAVKIGEASASILVEIGVPDTVNLDCYPLTGQGTYDLALEWVPDILLAPSVECELQAFGGTVHTVPVTLLSSVTAEGTLNIEQGWYTQFVRILESGELSAGIVETARIAYGGITEADYYLTVTQLEGEITFDATWTPYAPLALTTSHPEGDINVYPGDLFDISITDVDLDPATTAVYSWYMNGDAVAVGSTASYSVDYNDLELGASYYLSAVVWQSDGLRAGDANFKLVANEYAIEQHAIEASMSGVTSTGTRGFRLYADDGVTILDEQWVYGSMADPMAYTFEGLADGDYYLFAGYKFDDATIPPTSFSGSEWWEEAADAGTATLISIPDAIGATYDFGGLAY